MLVSNHGLIAPLLLRAPHFGIYCILFDTFIQIAQLVCKKNYFSQRTDIKSRAKALNMLKDRVTSPGKWPQVLLFPEGTCTNKSSLISFKRGAFAVGVPVQPIAVRWEVPFDYVTWTEISSGAIKLIWITLCQFRTTLKVSSVVYDVKKYLITKVDMRFVFTMKCCLTLQ